MTSSPLARVRRVWRDAHLWIGAGLAVLLIPLSLSGSVLVFHDELDRALHPERYAVSAPAGVLPASTYAAAASTAFADRAGLTQVRLPQRPGDPVVATGRLAGPPGPGGRPRTLSAWIDPGSGKVLAVAEPANDLTITLHRLHGSLLTPGIGRKIVGWLGWAMFISAATGLWLWWPRSGSFLKGVRWRRGASQIFNLHHMTGFCVCLPLATLSLTGVYIAFPQTARALFGVAPSKPEAGARKGSDLRFAAPLATSRLGIDQAIAAALAQAPNAKLLSVSLPLQSPEPAWRIELATNEAKAAVRVVVDDASGKAQRTRQSAGPGGQDDLSRWIRRIHDGRDLGVWRGVIALTGLAPTLLSVSGTMMWLRRRRARTLRPQPSAAAGYDKARSS